MKKPFYLGLVVPLTLVGAVLLTLLFVRPYYQKTTQARQDLATEKAKVVELEAKVQALRDLDEYELSEKTQLALKALPTRKEVFAAIGVINYLTDKTGVFVDSLTVNPGELSEAQTAEGTSSEETPFEETSLLDKLSFKLELLGTQESLRAFLEQLPEFIPLAEAKEAKLAVKEGQTSITLEFYFFPPPKTIGKPEDPLPALTASEEETYQLVAKLSYYVPEEMISPPTAPVGRANPFSF